MSILCALFGLSKQAYNKKIVTDGQKTLTFERAKRSVLDLRRQMPRLGTRKLHYLLKEKKIKVGEFGLSEQLGSYKQALLQIDQSIFAYNHLRPHLSCCMLTPKQMHNQQNIKLKTYNKKAQTTLVVD